MQVAFSEGRSEYVDFLSEFLGPELSFVRSAGADAREAAGKDRENAVHRESFQGAKNFAARGFLDSLQDG